MPEEKEGKQPAFISAGEHIDVDTIMADIRKMIEEKKEAGLLKQSEIDEIVDMELLALPDFQEVPNVYENHLYTRQLDDSLIMGFEIEQQRTGLKGLIKKALQKIRSLLLPIIRFAIRPALNDLARRYGDTLFKSREYIKILHSTVNNMIVESSKLKIEEEMLKTKIKVLEDKVEFLENRQRAIEKRQFK
jgi:hypothetical protein